MAKFTTCIWSNYTAQEQAEFYASLLPDGRVLKVQRSPVETPSVKAGDVLVVEFELAGQTFILLNGGPMFTHSEAMSLVIHTADQAETDRLWERIVGSGGQESMCGWCKDKWGVSWQITPQRLLDLVFDNPDAAAGERAMQAMMSMGRIDIAAIEQAAKAAPVEG